jgi:hypothetical protein
LQKERIGYASIDKLILLDSFAWHLQDETVSSLVFSPGARRLPQNDKLSLWALWMSESVGVTGLASLIHRRGELKQKPLIRYAHSVISFLFSV